MILTMGNCEKLFRRYFIDKKKKNVSLCVSPATRMNKMTFYCTEKIRDRNIPITEKENEFHFSELSLPFFMRVDYYTYVYIIYRPILPISILYAIYT